MRKKMLLACLCALSMLSLFGCKKDASAPYTVVDSNGKEHMVAADENGFIQKNEYEKMVEYVTDSSGTAAKDDKGEYVTKLSDFPYYVQNGNQAECTYFSFEIPDGWTLSGKQTMKLTHTENKAEISFTMRSTTPVESYIEEIYEIYADWDAEFTAETVSFKFGEAKKLSSKKIKEGAVVTYYVYAVNGNTFVISTTVYDAMSEGIDCEKIINEIHYR